ncbi:MAG: alanyl-tRNA synthetase, partial [Acidimicrobiaceae bacterium]|nr:alanyl-tRNA synthetase [Acidimicrobiaceae bacterium]
GLAADELKGLVVATRDQSGLRAVVLIGSPDGERVALAGAATKDSGIAMNTVIGEAAKQVGGGGGGKDATLATAGGRDVGAIDEALAVVRGRLGLPPL